MESTFTNHLFLGGYISDGQKAGLEMMVGTVDHSGLPEG